MIYIYFGYFENGKAEYALKTTEKISPNKLKWRMRGAPGKPADFIKNLPVLSNPGKEDYLVYNLKSENEWRISRSDNGFVFLNQIDLERSDLADVYIEDTMVEYHGEEISVIDADHILKAASQKNAAKNKTFIKGKNLPKIKSTKELNYVGKIDYIPVSVRNHADVGR